MSFILKAGIDDNGRRLDRILRKAFPDLSLPFIYKLLRTKAVLVDDKPAQASFRVKAGCTISIAGSGDLPAPSPKSNTDAFMPDVIWEGDGLLAVNKPAGIAVHGPHGIDKVVSAYIMSGLKHKSLSFKPGPLHRLDKISSGVLIFSTSLEGAQRFSTFMQNRLVQKRYFAIVEGTITEPKLWQDRLIRDKGANFSRVDKVEGSIAITRVFPICVYEGLSYIVACPETGRHHQIRVQAAAHGHPLAGDIKYGARTRSKIFLHAFSLSFPGLEKPIIAAAASGLKIPAWLSG